ncbi:hypothetical protein PAHAL_1G364900 [Panicum hallii]|uniref:Uncharacterized protein n=1 Tax=Panicum hallii TaxID=206008 RepID=A0A2T8KXC9_9POAL|nr:hypothetical protein PAHAL_1G364900 [Panicum hallii]
MTVESSCLDFPLIVRNTSSTLHQSHQNNTKGASTYADLPCDTLSSREVQIA